MEREREDLFARPLETARLLLRPFREEDADAFFDLMREREVNAFLPFFAPETREEAKRLLEERFLRGGAEAEGMRYAVTLREDGRWAGYVTADAGEAHDHGYALGRAYWGRGLATEAARAAAERARTAGWPFLTATHDVNNPASGRVMRRIGMTYRDLYRKLGQPKDILATFRFDQLDFGGPAPAWRGYWDRFPDHAAEEAGDGGGSGEKNRR